MANRYDIIHIDFQASARGANAAIESIRQEADKCNTRISELKKNIAEAPKNGTDAKIVEGWNEELKVSERRFKQFSTAQKELVKGMRALDEGVKMFNDGSLSTMNAAFQKTVNNAAKLAQSKLTTGTKEWRDMGALMQETEQNYARMQRDTDQLIESLQNGGTVFRKTLEDEKKGLQDLLQVLPYMSTEYRKADEQLQFLTKTTEELAVKERQLKGEIVTTDDARRVSLQLTEKGAEEARKRAAAADVEIEKGKQEIEILEKEREAREANARASAQSAAKYREDQQMYEDEIDRLQREIEAEEKRAKSGKSGVEAMYRKAKAAGETADKEIEAQKKLDAEYEAAKQKFTALRDEYEKMKQASAGAPVNDTAASAEKRSAEETAEASKKKTEAKKEEKQATEKVVEVQKNELATEEELRKALKDQETAIRALRAEREKLAEEQRKGAEATKTEANAFADLSKEQAEALLQQKQMQSTVSKGADGKFAYTNAEEAQRFLIESMKQVNPANAKGNAMSLDDAGVAKVRTMFKERYGITDDADALAAIRGLISGENGGLIKGGMMNNAFSRIDLDVSKVAAYNKEVKDLTAVIKGETKATEENVEAKRAVSDLDEEIRAKEKEQRETTLLLRRVMEGHVDTVDTTVKKNEALAESHKKSAAAIKEEVDAVKQMNAEQASAMKKEMTTPSTIGYKAGKLEVSNLEEVQHFLLTQISKKGTADKDGTFSLAGQNVDNLLTAFQNKYGLSGKKQEAKQMLKELVSGKNGGLFSEGGIVDFNAETLSVKVNTEAYQGRLEKLKALIGIVNKASYEAAHSTETTKKDTQAVKDATEATKGQTDAIKEQEQEVARRRKAFESKNADYEAKNAKLKDMRAALGRLPNSGPDAGLMRYRAEEEIKEYNENYVKPARAEKTKLKGLWEKSVKDLMKMQGMDTEETKKNTDAQSQNAEATEKSTKSKRGKQKASEDVAKATAEEAQKSAELIAKEKEMKEAEAEFAKALENAEAQQKKANDAKKEAEAAADKAKQSEADLVKSLDEKSQKLKENKAGLEKLNEANKNTIATNEENQKLLEETNAKIAEQGEKIRDAERIKAQANTEGIEKTEQAIRILQDENRTIDTNSDKWVENTQTIQHLQQALDEMKGKPALMMMEERMKNVGSLSAAAVTETRKFWESMVAGAEKGSEKMAQAEAHLKTITEEEQKRSRAALEASAKRLNGNLGNLSQDELRQAINDAKLLQSTYKSTSKEAQELAQAIVNAEDHVRRYGVEAERAARKQEEADKKATRAARDKEEADRKAQQEQHTMMQQRAMLERNRTTLSAAALAETKKYWQAVKDGAEEGSVAQRNALRIMEKITAEEQRRNTAANAKKAGILSGTLSDYSEGEIREAIEAGKQLILTYKSGSEEAKKMGEAIAKAEEHIKNVGLDAQRTAVRQEQAITKIREEGADTLERAQNGEFATASMDELDKTIKKLKEYQALIKDPNGTGKEAFETTKEQVDALTEQLNKLKGVAEKVKGSFKDADEVLARFGEHMNAGKTSSEGMAQTLEEKLNNATWEHDDWIKDDIKNIDEYEQNVRKATAELDKMEKELAELEAKHKNSSWFRQQTKAYRKEGWRIEDLRDAIGDDVLEDAPDGGVYVHGAKGNVAYWKRGVEHWQKQLEKDKQWKADELGIKPDTGLADVQRMTNEQMQEGIKLLEEEYVKTDHTTEEGIKRRQELRSAIDQMNQEIKESTGEWMTYAEAEKFAAKAGGQGFIATGRQMQQATQALERQRDALIKTIQLKQKDGKATKDEEAELEKLEKQLKDLKFEQDNFNMSHKKMQQLLEHPNKSADLDELKAAIKRADGELHRMEGSLEKNSKEYQEFAAQVKNAKNTLKEMEGQARASSTAWEKAWTRLKTYVVMYVGANAALQRLMGTMGDLMDLSDKMGEVRKTTGFTADEVGRLSENLKNLDVRTSLTQLMDISAKAGQLGLKTIEDVEGFTVAANKLMIALPEMGSEAATEMMRVAIATGEVDKIRKQLEEGTVEGTNATAVAMEKIASTIDRLRASSAATAPEITDFVKRLGAVGAQSGISIDQISAIGSTVSSLGMRVEMSATALSRMIPAIRNNAFEVAKAIKVEPAALRNLFETGRGMEAILMIFQHIKDAGMDEDSIEKLLGMAGMQDVMKQLNQQGARAGIVFAGLSQNVEELRRQLGVAAQAYEENIAIQQEFDRMNETTAAKWERFKNEIEEAFVRDEMQRGLGWIIDGLRTIVNLLTGNVTPALQVITGLIHTFLVYFGVLKLGLGEGIMKAVSGFKAMGDGIKGLIASTKMYLFYSRSLRNAELALAAAKTEEARATAAQSVANIKAKMTQEGLNKAMLANIWTAVAAAIVAAVIATYNWIQNVREAAREAGRFEAEAQKNIKAANKMIDAVGKARVKIEDAEVAVRKARKELEEAKKANDGTAEAVKRLKDAETELLVQEEKKRMAMAEHKRLIEQFNTQYSKYLGFMLSEVSSNLELAKARDLVNSKLRETITLKQREAGLERVEKNMGESRDERYGNVKNMVYDRIKDPTKAARAMQDIVDAAQRQDDKLVMSTLKKYGVANGLTQKAVHDYMDELKKIKEAQDAVITQTESDLSISRETSQKNLVGQVNEAFRTYNNNLAAYRGASGDDKAKAAAAVLQQMDTLREMQQSAGSYYKMDNTKQGKIEEARYKKQMGGLIGWQGYNREELLKAAGKYYTPRKDVNGELTPSVKDETNGGWGSDHEASSTDWKNMTAEQLVNRRKQMKDFVNAIQTDSDVQSVLGEDAALKKAIENGMSSDMRTVIEWYNTERLKIQDELHARHLTNTGDWMDPKKQKARRKRLQDDMKAYLEELDAYYTERKTHIQEAGNEEGLTEAEVRNRTLANEMEWRQRRAELQIMYSAKAKQVTQDEQDAIHNIIAERTGDDVKFIKATIDKTVEFSKAIRDANAQGAKEYRKFQGDLDLGSQKDYNKQQMALRQHLKAIQDIIDKERPFNGITKNLRENLVTMDILTADMRDEYNELMKAGKDMTDFNRRQAEEEVRRTTFLLGEAEHAYSTTVEQVMSNMAAKGMTAWAEQLKQSPEMREGMMAQLRSTYDAIQEAIKKEASLMKKQAEIMWNNILMPGGDGKTTVKDAFEQAIAQLGIEQGRVSRANSMIGAGATSDRVADKLAIKQMQLQLTMQTHYYNLMRKQGMQRIKDLERQGDELERQGKLEEASRVRQDKEHAEMSLRLATTKEQTELLKQQEEIIAKTEESQARLYQQLKEWGDLITSSMQGVFEAESAGNREYYNELAKMNLTGKGGPGAGTYIVIENEGTDEAKAHYEWLDQREALERQHQIEIQNARADAWKKVMDDINMKMSDMITDQINAMLQNEAVDANTSALYDNTAALYALAAALGVGAGEDFARNEEGFAVDAAGKILSPVAPAEPAEKQEQNAGLPGWGWPTTEEEKEKMKEWDQELLDSHAEYSITKMQEVGDAVQDLPSAVTSPFATSEVELEKKKELIKADVEAQKEGQKEVTQSVVDNSKQQQTTTTQANKKIENSGNSLYAHLTSACNLYGAAYQAMSNDNLSATQKFEMIGLQAAGNAAIAALTAANTENNSKTVSLFPLIFGKCVEINPIAGAAIFAALTAVIGGLMGMAASKVAKGKAEIQKVTGASASAGRLATGMMTYAEGNVNELTDPDSLTPGRSYNVDGADGRTYRAKYTGRNARTHITSGPEFHLVGEKGQEAIIDAHTTRNIRLNEPQIWQDIQTLYNGGRLSATRRRTGSGVRTFADGNLDDFEEVDSVLGDGTEAGLGTEQMQQLQASLDRNSDVLERAVTEGIHARFDVYGKGGLIDSYDTGKKNVTSHGERY